MRRLPTAGHGAISFNSGMTSTSCSERNWAIRRIDFCLQRSRIVTTVFIIRSNWARVITGTESAVSLSSNNSVIGTFSTLCHA